MAAAGLSAGRALSLIHHVFLPPKLPDRLEDDAVDIDTALVSSVGQALHELADTVAGRDAAEHVQAAQSMVTRLWRVRDDKTGFLHEEPLCSALFDVFSNGGYLALPIAAQNAGVLISKSDTADPVIETLELSPSQSHVVPTKGRLQRSFPGPSFSISADTASTPDFQSAMAQVLAQMSRQDPAEAKAKAARSRRARRDDSTEDADTEHPMLVTELFASMFMAAGTPAAVQPIIKNTRDEAMWAGAHRPWRRSSAWLLLRVALQSVFTRATGNHDLYKCFVAFYLASLARSLPTGELETDVLHTMISKMQRRLSKLGEKPLRENAWIWMATVSDTLAALTALVQKRWDGIQATDRPPYAQYLGSLGGLDFENDTHVHIPALEQHIEGLRKSNRRNETPAFRPDASRSLPLFSSTALPVLHDDCPADYQHFQLLAFELWVQQHLFDWLKANRDSPRSCPSIYKTAKQYHAMARAAYNGNPETTSLSILTLLELWMAVDVAAGAQCPLLHDYDHEVPAQVLQALLLPRVEQMRRLVRAEMYLASRTSKASSRASVFRAFGTDASLSVRFFDQSPHHKALRQEIEDHARQERRARVAELASKTAEYQRLQHLAATTRCDYVRRPDSYSGGGGAKQLHHPQCQRHAYLAAAENLEIAVHEWPLPEDDLACKSAVFELQVPPAVRAWRDCTLFVVHDVLGSIVPDGEPLETDYSPRVYAGLKQWARGGSRQPPRLGIRSTTRPTVVAHGATRMLSEAPRQDDVCVANGLTYCYYDTVLGVVADTPEATDELTRRCTYTLPERSSSSALQGFLQRPWGQPHGQPPNEVLASQHTCPPHMPLDAFKALASLPLGIHVQWMNLLVQLRMPAVDLRQVETCLFVLQLVHQAGPPLGKHTPRQAHQILRDEEFVAALLDAVQDNYTRIADNWMAYLALGSLVCVTTKLLSVTIDDEPRTRCLTLLSQARQTAVAWARLLSERAASSARDDEREQFRGQALDVALVGISAFDMDEATFHDLPSGDIAILLECSVLVQEKKPTTINPADTMRCLLLARWRRILYEHREQLQDAVASGDGDGARPLDTAIAQSWPTHTPGSQWTALPAPNQHWLTSTSSSTAVHFNLLTGQLLVNGAPLSRLPPDYEAHPMYRVLFGETAIEAMPNTEPSTSLQFAGKTLYHGHMLQFDLLEGDYGTSDLTVRAKHVDSASQWQLLPARLLHGHFPAAFVDKHVHWLHLAENTIEFRPIDRPWATAIGCWTLSALSTNGRRLRRDNGSTLLSIKSQTADILHNILRPLEDGFSIHSTLLANGNLEIDLARLGIGFTVANNNNNNNNSAQLECRQFRDYVVAPDQSIGTLVGLQSRLIVQHRASGSKLLLTPSRGQIRFRKEPNHHVRVSMEHGTADRVVAYEVDPLLGRVVDTGDLPSKLLLCYLHALTSFALPDPLTRHTGTEQALAMLSSAAVLSYGRLDQHSLGLLEKIAALAPARQYCPTHTAAMQRVEWSSGLGFLAQHGRLLTAVSRILDEYETSLLFYPEDAPAFHDVRGRIRERADAHLVERDLVMSSFLRLSGFGAEDALKRQDHFCQGRDVQTTDPGRCARVYSIAFPAMTGLKRFPPGSIPFAADTDLSTTLWKLVSGSSNTEATQGPDASLGDKLIGFDTAWLKNLKVLFLRHWCRLHRELASGAVSRYTVATWLATLAYNSTADDNTMQALQALWAVCSSPTLGLLCAPPMRSSFHLFVGRTPDRAQLQSVVTNALRRLDARAGMTASEQRLVSAAFIDSLMASWPTAFPLTPSDDFRYRQYINTLEAMEGVLPLFRTWHDNVLFGEYLDGLAKGVQQCRLRAVLAPERPAAATHWLKRDDNAPFIPLQSLFQSPMVAVGHAPSTYRGSSSDDLKPRPVPAPAKQSSSNSIGRLAALVGELRQQAKTQSQHAYADSLATSLASLEALAASEANQYRGSISPNRLTSVLSRGDLERHVKRYHAACQRNASDRYQGLVNGCNMALPDTHQLPRLSPTVFLTQLQSRQFSKLSPAWKTALVDYALSLVALHRAARLCSLCGAGHEADFNKELANTGHGNWKPLEHPEWLLLEVESGITIRDVQHEIAVHMIAADAGNAVMQLNMGEGKSSVIVPMVATAVSNEEGVGDGDGDRLVRVLVAKAQSKQMLEMLLQKTAGLLGRRIFHFPFARPVAVSSVEDARRLDQMLRTCQAERGILLVQPEHVLSFQLMGLERIMRGEADVGNAMVATQHYLDGHARDIVDESDAIFSAKFELVYTLGDPRPTELSPGRWIIVQELLDMVVSAVVDLKRESPDAVEVLFDFDDADADAARRWPGRFPRTRLLKQDIHSRFVHLVATHLCSCGVRGFPIALQPDSVRNAVFRYLTTLRLTDAEVAVVEQSVFWTDATKGPLLLLRGLLAGGILVFVLATKRWRVNYGPAPANRSPPTQLVVPYQSKDMPSPRSEFSHPDVVLLLTSLHYYYAGLSNGQLFQALHRLVKDDQPGDEYALWVRTARSDLPPSFRQLSGVSLDDQWQCTDKLFPHLCFSKAAIDYYLANIVFPAHMKESPDKISASGWDLAKAMQPTAANVTTGFSGTNDARPLLPLSVKQLDQPQQNHTNALVLSAILRDENAVHLLPSANTGGAEALLAEVVKLQPPVKVLLDVGAQVLELSNLQASRRWLEQAPSDGDGNTPEAVVFFDDDDVLSVVDRAGRVEPLQASPYAKQLDACLVFLDEAHTRGTDLRLPTNYRAAATLGANLTKDRLVQACMRMRKLGQGQSVVFCVPSEIHDKIRAVRGTASTSDAIAVADVLAWAIHETQQELHKYMPLWAMHGRRFAWQDALWSGCATGTSYNMTQPLAVDFKEVEARSLEQRYLPRNSPNYVDEQEHSATEHADTALLQAIDDRCRAFVADSRGAAEDASFSEEQERELAPEIEEERQRATPPPAVAHPHAVHADVLDFVNTGELKADSAALLPAFEVLAHTSVEQHVSLGLLPSLVMATVDFARTVKGQGTDKGSSTMLLDVFQRTPQFVLTPAKATTDDHRIDELLLISPFEANKLLPLLQHHHTAVRLHLYAARVNMAFSPLDTLDLYVVGSSPFIPASSLSPRAIVALNLFAGQLYFRSWEEYADVASFLGLIYRTGEAGAVASADGFVRSVASGTDKRRDAMSAGLQESPVAFLRVLMGQVRRNAASVEKTHIGKMLDGILLTEKDFEVL
ncbi:hypothetical protein SCUCBS95973_001530 [Sporothrix curviconia]|uniref:ubiquitinyl hydrolase 1 n=1 Tax=Sporothrix curviconia TaxID=1260050 RepID=A0ABP0AZH8_9PEZI